MNAKTCRVPLDSWSAARVSEDSEEKNRLPKIGMQHAWSRDVAGAPAKVHSVSYQGTNDVASSPLSYICTLYHHGEDDSDTNLSVNLEESI